MSYDKQRKRNDNSQREKLRIGFKQGFRLWLNSWKWSNIKSEYNKEYSNVKSGAEYRLQQIKNKMG